MVDLTREEPEEALNLVSRALKGLVEEDRIILDFDHTLLLANSTELFVSLSCKSVLGRVVDFLAIRIWTKLRRLTSLDRDHFRVLCATLFNPMVWLLWSAKAPIYADLLWNKELWNACKLSTAKRITVASFGYSSIIRPLIKAYSELTGQPRPRLIASSLFSFGPSNRAYGKAKTIEKIIQDINWQKTFFISDSIDDIDALLKSGTSYLVTWEAVVLNEGYSYLPFRYIQLGKYLNEGYLKNQILKQDLFIWLVLVCTDFWSFLSAIFLFLSFFAVYEAGYYENDFRGVRFEKKATTHASLMRFVNYPIEYRSWLVAILLASLGCFLAHRSVDINFFLKLFSFLFGLGITRFTFRVYNSVSPVERVKLYYVLQIMKNFSATLVLAPNVVGALLATAHLIQHSTVYAVYRCGGNTKLYQRVRIRTVLFVFGVLVVAYWQIPLLIGTLIVCLAWLFYFELEKDINKIKKILFRKRLNGRS